MCLRCLRLFDKRGIVENREPELNAPDVSLIIISLNSRHYLEDCLRSIHSAIWHKYTYEIVVVDNGSTDGTLEILADRHPEVRVVSNQSNLGYCKAGNQGAKAALGRLLLFLNDDLLILEDAIPQLIRFMDDNPKAGMIGSRLLNPDGSDQFSSGRTFPTPSAALFGRKSYLTRKFPNAFWARKYLLSDKVDGTSPYRVDWVSAAAMMASRPAFLASGGLVESFYYFHEQIICARMQKAGFDVYLHPTSRIIHFEGVGSGVRTKRIRILHIKRFHIAAYRWFCLHQDYSKLNPVRIPIAAVLALRAGALMAIEALRPDPQPVLVDVNAGRPEGGVPL